MTSLPPSQCCIGGSLHDGETKGELTKFGDICRTQSLSLSLSLSLPEDAYWTLEDMLSNPCPVPFRPRPVPVYVSYPPDKSTHHAILFLSDIFGLALVNSKLIADLFAANGYFVVMPDLFQGDPVPVDHSPSFQVMDWLQGHLPPQTDPIVTATLREMRERLGCQRIGGVGYCYGGKYVVRYLHPGQLDVGFVAHPTFIEPDELEAIEGPLSISASARDNLFPPEKRHESEKILAKLDVPYQINIFSDVEHGFAVRCDLNKTRHRFAKEQSFSQGVTWFNQYLKK